MERTSISDHLRRRLLDTAVRAARLLNPRDWSTSEARDRDPALQLNKRHPSRSEGTSFVQGGG